MNTNGLVKRYQNLSAEERFRLLLAAIARDDELEVDRIHSAAKRVRLSVHDTTGFVLGTSEALMWLMTQRLKLALCMTETLYHAAEMESQRHIGSTSGDSQLEDRAHRTAGMFAYLLKIHTESARLFIDEVGATALEDCGSSPLEPLRADPFLLRAEETAGHLALSEDEMNECLRPHSNCGVKTTASILSEAREIRDFFVRRWS